MSLADILNDVVLLVALLYQCICSYVVVLVSNLSWNSRKKVNGQVVLITGAAGGIGGRLVEHFYNLGCRVVCVDNDRESLDALKNKLLGNINSVFVNPERFRFFYVDVSCAADVSSMVAEIKREWHCVDILINNAGIMNHGKLLLELSNDEIMNIFNVNILAQMRLCKELLPSMIENKRGHIVNVASSCGLMGAYKLTDYCATKFAVVGFSEALRVELKTICDAHKLTVTTVCPFHVKTKMFDGVEFTRLKWLNLSMEIEYVVKHIVDGILMNKELILIPSLFTHLLIIIRSLVPTTFVDKTQQMLEMHVAIDKYRRAKD